MQKIRKIRLTLLAIGLVGAVLGMVFAKSNSALIPVFLVLAAGGMFGHLIYTLVAWRCPHCGRLLPTKHAFWSKYCPYCGKELD
jgi:zinc transporter ZupT